MNKNDFINAYSIKTEKTKKESAILVDTFLETLKESLIAENKVAFIGDFSLEVVPTKERKGVNPATGEDLVIPAGKKLKFKIGKTFKDEILG
jgi:DNA-binding protein HU-beta